MSAHHSILVDFKGQFSLGSWGYGLGGGVHKRGCAVEAVVHNNIPLEATKNQEHPPETTNK